MTFSLETYKERLARARQALREAGCSACLSVAPEHHFYFSGYDSWVGVNSPQALIFGLEDRAPDLVVRDVDLPLARESFRFGEPRTYALIREDPAALMAGLVEQRAGGDGPVAIELASAGLTAAFAKELEAALAPRAVIDATALLGALRLQKSPEEIALLEQAAGHAEAGLEVLRACARPGLSEVELSSKIEQAVRASGSDYWAIPVELASGPRSAGGHATATTRVMQSGDLLHAEFAGVAERYHAVAFDTVALGEPGPRARELYELARASLRAGMAVIAPGVPVDAVEEASLAPLRPAGLEDAAMMRFGYGVGIAYPPIWLEALQIARGFDTRLETGMVFVLHACLELPDEDLGVILGGTYQLREDGLKQLVGRGDVPLSLL